MEGALIHAVKAGDVAAVRALLEEEREGQSPGAATRKVGGSPVGKLRDSDGADCGTALHAAVVARRPDILALLLRDREGVRVDARDGAQQNPHNLAGLGEASLTPAACMHATLL
jgi:hypothetical protein